MPYVLRLHSVAAADELLAVPGSDGRRFNLVPPLIEFRPFPFPWRGERAAESDSATTRHRGDPVLVTGGEPTVWRDEELRARLPLLARVENYGMTAFDGDELDRLATELLEADAMGGPGEGAGLGAAGRAITRLRPHLVRAVFHGL